MTGKKLSEALNDAQIFEEAYREGLELFKDKEKALDYARRILAMIQEDRKKLKEILAKRNKIGKEEEA